MSNELILNDNGGMVTPTIWLHGSKPPMIFSLKHQETALILASAYGHANIVEVLLNSHANVDLDDVV